MTRPWWGLTERWWYLRGKFHFPLWLKGRRWWPKGRRWWWTLLWLTLSFLTRQFVVGPGSIPWELCYPHYIWRLSSLPKMGLPFLGWISKSRNNAWLLRSTMRSSKLSWPNQSHYSNYRNPIGGIGADSAEGKSRKVESGWGHQRGVLPWMAIEYSGSEKE